MPPQAQIEPLIGPLPYTHLTLTGVYAGTPFCNINKERARAAGHAFQHLPYCAGFDIFPAHICKGCILAYESAKEGDTEE